MKATMRWGTERSTGRVHRSRSPNDPTAEFIRLLKEARECAEAKKTGDAETIAQELKIPIKKAYGLVDSLAVEGLLETSGNTWTLKK